MEWPSSRTYLASATIIQLEGRAMIKLKTVYQLNYDTIVRPYITTFNQSQMLIIILCPLKYIILDPMLSKLTVTEVRQSIFLLSLLMMIINR